MRQRPTSPAALATIKGLGRARIERHGAALLEAIAAHPQAAAAADAVRGPTCRLPATPARAAGPRLPRLRPRRPSPRTPCPDRRMPASASKHVSTEEWTWRLVDRGFTIDEAAAIRGLEPAAIIRHLTWMVRRGHQVPVESFLAPEIASAWDAWRAAHGDAAPPAEPADAAALWPLFLACRAAQK